MMLALVLRENSFQIESLPKPILGEGEVLVKISYAALNHRDQWIREGKYPKIVFPCVLGSDGVGEVVDVYNNENNYWLNKKVIINPNINWGLNNYVQDKNYHILGMPTYGTLAEYLKVNVDRLVIKPDYLSLEEAAAIPLAGLTAWNAVFNKGALAPEKKILVSGVGGGVAQFAFLFANAINSSVYVSSSKNSVLEKCIALGAKEGINYTIENNLKNKAKEIGGIDVIVDSAGGDQINDLLTCLKPNGKLVFYGATLGAPNKLNVALMFWNHLSLMGSTMGSDQDFLTMIDFINKHQIKPILDETFSLDNAIAAFDKMKSGNQFGKIIIKI